MRTRREFLKSSAFTTAASIAGVAGAPQFAFGQSSNGKTLIKVFMRGGADGLHLFPPTIDPFYREYRPNLAIEEPNQQDSYTAVDLGHSYRALNPNLELLKEIWDDGRLMIAPATALPEGNRSHFDNQRWIGTGAQDNYIDGYLNRYMQLVPGVEHSLRGAILGKTSRSREISGEVTIPAISGEGGFDVSNRWFCTDPTSGACAEHELTEYMRGFGTTEVNGSPMEQYIRDNQFSTVEAIDEVAGAESSYTLSGAAVAQGLDYSETQTGRGLKVAAQLLKGNVPLEVACIDWNVGWDSHSNQITSATANDRFVNADLQTGARDFLTFYKDLGELIDDVVVIVGTEFGRTVLENGSLGTDHGHGGPWFAFGGPTNKIMADDVSSLEMNGLLLNRYIPTVTNYRDILGEIMIRHMGMSDTLVDSIFPGHDFTDLGLFA
ncbi:DUF1501 domain-containing protein [Yoonia sp. BS5-3]|uniref:DUF1501 domain-containing protein n=1 Tax=Yoonia phaeophyticola TaxID=3137369 RepID=A0ABZ2V8I2_9RHOB